MGFEDVGIPKIDESIYSALYGNAFSKQETAQLVTTKKISKLHADLIGMGSEGGYEKFSNLDVNVKDQLKYMYGEETDYMMEPESFFGKAFNLAKDFITSPLTNLMSVAEDYGQAVNATQLQFLQMRNNNKSFFDVDVFKTSLFDGETLYNNKLDEEYVKKYGKEKVFIAKMSLAGYQPGEIFDAYGTVDDKFIGELEDYMNGSTDWDNTILEDYRQAKLSVGREAANFFLGNRNGGEYYTNGYIYDSLNRFGLEDWLPTTTRDENFTLVSGRVDAAAQILMDPLTYVTGGVESGIRVLGQSSIKFGAKTLTLSQKGRAYDLIKSAGKVDMKTGDTIDMVKNLDEAFSLPQVQNFWNGYGEQITRLKVARERKNTKLAAEIQKDISLNYPRHGTDADIQHAYLNDFTSAEKVKNYFIEAKDFTMLLSGRTTDSSYFMNSVGTARKQRNVANVFRRTWHNITTSNTSGNAAKEANEVVKELLTLGGEDAFIVSTPTIARLSAKDQDWKRSIVNMLAKHPSDESIIVGVNAAETLQTVRNIFGILAPTDVANIGAEAFLAANTAERIVMLRGSYRAIGHLLGVDKTVHGREALEAMIDAKFSSGMVTNGVIAPPKHFDIAGDTMALPGGIYDNQTTNTIGNFNWEAMRVIAADNMATTLGKSAGDGDKINLIAAVGGAVNGTLGTKVVDNWSFLTLAPKLGIRSGIDEGFFFYLSAPRQVLFNVIAGKSAGIALTKYTASKAATGAVTRGIRRMLGKYGKDPVTAISLERRQELMETAILTVKASGETLKGIQSKTNRYNIGNRKLSPYTSKDAVAIEKVFQFLLAQEAVFDSHLMSASQKAHMVDLMISNPHAVDSSFSSLARSTLSGGTIEKTVDQTFFSDTLLTAAQKEFDTVFDPKYSTISPSALTTDQMHFIMYNEFYKKFYKNYLTISSKSTGKSTALDLGDWFIKNNGLKTTEDFTRFTGEIVRGITSNKAILSNFLDTRTGTLALRQQGLSDIQIVQQYANTMASDLYIRFHGGADQFNDALLAGFLKNDGLKTNIELIEKLSFQRYATLVGDNIRRTDITTDIRSFDGFQDTASGHWSKYKEKGYEMMDRTATAMVRQPAVMAYYLYYRDLYKGSENAFREKLFENMLDDAIKRNPIDLDEDRIGELADSITRKRFAEIASKSAVSHTLKFVDNPHVRSYMTSSFRNINRFGRATEDFWRRIYRLKDAGPRAIYRMRLLHSGLNGVGSIEKDENGESYFILPMDNVIFGALDTTIRTLSGNDAGFKQPVFNEFTVKLTAMNPSFQDSAGIPFFSGPIAGIGVLGLQSIVGQWGGETGALVADEMDNYLLGDMGDNLDLRKAIEPALVGRMLKSFDQDEKSVYNHTATLSALAYNQANGKPIPEGSTEAERIEYLKNGYLLPVDATPKERATYLQNVRVSAHNLYAIRSMLGLILPFTVGSQESVDIPDYVKDTGVTNIRSEYFDILDTVINKYGADVSDPFELAAAIFVGDNPNKLIYTVSREDKKIKPLIKKTDAARTWIIKNQGFIDTYGEAAYLFSPNKGEVNLAMYQWMKAAGLSDTIDAEEYLTNLQVAVDKQKYFGIEDWENEKLAVVTDYYGRRAVIEEATRARTFLKTSNPLLEDSLAVGGFDVAYEEGMLSSLKSIIEDPNSPLNAADRRRVQNALDIFDNGYKYVTNPYIQSYENYSEIKAGMRDRTLDELYGVSAGDPLVEQIIRLIFKPLMKFNARNVPSTSLPSGSPYPSLGM